MAADNFRNLTVYKKAFALALEIFQSYITADIWNNLELKAEEVGKLLNHVMENPKKYQRQVVVTKKAKSN